MIEINDHSVANGERIWIDVPITEDVGKHRLSLPLFVVNGNDDGPVLWIQAGVFGDEYLGTAAVRDFARSVSVESVRGTIICVPVVNLSAFRAESREAPIRTLDNKDLFRNFAPTPNETFSFNKLLTEELYSHITAHADYVVDVHSARLYAASTGVSLYAQGERERQSKELAKSTGYSHVVGIDPGDYQFGLFERLSAAGISSIVTMAGGEGRAEPKYYDDAVRSLEGVGRFTGVLDGDHDSDHEPRLYHGLEFVTASEGGIFERDVDLEASVSSGDVLGSITSYRGETREVIEATKDGVVLRAHTFGSIRPGQLAYILAPV